MFVITLTLDPNVPLHSSCPTTMFKNRGNIMSRTIGSNGEVLPMAYNGCNCLCHRQSGVKHLIPCCFPGPSMEELKCQKEKIKIKE